MAAGPLAYWWAAPSATLFATLGAGIFAFLQIRTNRQMTRLRASLDLIERTESQQFYQDMRKGFRASHAKKFENLTEDERTCSLYLLNHYEIIAIGCYAEVLDKKFYKLWMRSALARDWRAAESFIWGLRHPANKPPSGLRH